MIVGASGVGKDTLLNGTRAALAANQDLVFVRREITRPRDCGAEDHIEVSPTRFQQREQAGCYALSWQAHGLCYGVPATVREQIRAGLKVVVNGSRATLERARLAFPGLRVVVVTASGEAIGQRLVERGRETALDITKRLARGEQFAITGADVVEVRNDTTIAAGVERLIAAIRT